MATDLGFDRIARVGKGVLIAAAATLLGMALMALGILCLSLPDGALTPINQILKILSICLGAAAAVGRGGEKGFATGAAAGLIYMILGYGLYCLFGGGMVTGWLLAGEFLMGALIGGVAGAVAANLKPGRKPASARRTGRRRPQKRPHTQTGSP